jgi:Ni/Co efflux regulator RcnB
MKNRHFVTFALGVALAAAPALSIAAPQHPDNHGHAAASYHFRAQDKAKLQPHYRAAQHTQKVDPAHRWAWRRGQNLPDGWHDHIEALPEGDIHLLPAAPAGYIFGYYDGWAVVYDPNTGVVLDAIDVM